MGGACIVNSCVCVNLEFGVPEVVHVGDLLHTQPAELTGAHGAVHAVAAAVVGLHDVGAAAGTRLDLLCIFGKHGSQSGRLPRPHSRTFILSLLQKKKQ